MHNFWWTLFFLISYSYSIIPCHMVSHVIITWSCNVIHTTPISHTHYTIHNQSTYGSHLDDSLLHYTNRATLFQNQNLGPFTLFKTPTGAFHPCPTLTNTYLHLHRIQPALWLNWLPTLCYWAILHYNTGYTYIISITSLASNFSMIGLNRLIHDLTQALPDMKLKKESCQIFTKVRCTNLHGGRV